MKFLQKIILLLLLWTSFGYAQELPDKVGIKQNLGSYIPEDVLMVDDKGDTVNIKEAIDKPTLFACIYYMCPSICTPFLEEIVAIVDKMNLKISEEYQLFVIGISPYEGTDLAIEKKTNFLNALSTDQTLAEKGIRFFTGDSSNIRKITSALGFQYKRVGNDYTHAKSLMFVSPDAKITRYLNAKVISPFDAKMAITEAQVGKESPSIARIVQYCFSYDPVGGTYTLNITTIVATITILLALTLFFILVAVPAIKKRSRKK